MTAIFSACEVTLIAGLLCAVSASAAGGEPRSVENRLTVLLYDYVRLHPGTRGELIREAKWVLGRAGILTQFVECHVAGAPMPGPECASLAGPACISLRILDDKHASQTTEVGFATGAPALEGFVTVFINPARQRATIANLDNGTLLGCVVAHEIGHLLLGPGAHSTQGIMRARWRAHDEHSITQRRLVFNMEQASRMREALLKARFMAPVTRLRVIREPIGPQLAR